MFQLSILSGNSSAGNCTAGTADIPEPQVVVFKVAFIALGVLNLALNSVSMLVFLLHRQKEPIIRVLLLLLSATEVLASFGMSNVEISRLILELARDRVTYSSASSARHLVDYLSVTWALANTALLARNWCIVLIAVSRCEAVVKPFSRNTGRCCGHRAVWATFAGIAIVALMFGTPKAFQERFHYCQETGRIVGKDFVPPFGHYSEFYLTSMVFQAVLPILIVGLASAAMVVCLRRHRRRAGVGPSRAHSKATRMIQLLLVVFVCMETPMFLTVLLGIKTQDFGGDQVWDTFMMYAVEVSNLCINFDSTCNFIVYMKTNGAFRAAILRRRRMRAIGRRRTCNSTNNVTKHINDPAALAANGSFCSLVERQRWSPLVSTQRASSRV